MSDNKWIEWKGGECPVPAGTLVDVRYRGHPYKEQIGVPALEYGSITVSDFWRKDLSPGDIIAYRLHQPEQSAWNGEGLPPVGTECEAHKLSRDNSNNWMRVKIMYVSDVTVVMRELEVVDNGEEIHHPRTLEFRPIRTEAERKREEFASAISDKSVMGEQWQMKVVGFTIYDAIAAGKIPGVKLL